MNKLILANKQKMVDCIIEDVKKFSNLFVVEYRGLNVTDLVKLRRELTNKNMKINIYKNSFMLRALSKLKIKLDDYLEGPNAFVFAKDEMSCSNILFNFSKQNEKLVIKSGFINNEIMKADKINIIANLPNKEGLIMMFLNCLRISIIKFLCVVAKIKEGKK